MGMFSSLPSSVLTSTAQPTSACKAHSGSRSCHAQPQGANVSRGRLRPLAWALYLPQGDGGDVHEVVVGSFEPRVGFLLDNEGDVSWNDVWALKLRGKKTPKMNIVWSFSCTTKVISAGVIFGP